MKKMYGLVAIISTIVRQFYLPNPFECFGDIGLAYNWIASLAIHPIAFALVGLFYKRGSAPAVGSFLYLIMYATITGILVVMSIFEFTWWWVALVITATIAVLASLRKLRGEVI